MAVAALKRIAAVARPREPVLGLIGTGIGLFGDVASFFDIVRSNWITLSVVIAGLATAGVLCWMKVRGEPDDQLDAASECPECKGCRVALFAAATLAILAFIGGEGSALERAVGRVEQDVAVVKTGVADLQQTLTPQAIIDDARTMADHYHNAFAYQYMRNDPAQALKSVRQLYRLGANGRLDAAELYMTSASAVLGSASATAEIVALGRKLRDPGLLVVGARATTSDDEARALMAEAQAADPAYPFAWWDYQQMQRQPQGRPLDIAGNIAALGAQKAALDRFAELYAAKPESAFFFRPSMAGGQLQAARNMSGSLAQTIRQYEEMSSPAGRKRMVDQFTRQSGQTRPSRD